jgi:TolB-like protein
MNQKHKFTIAVTKDVIENVARAKRLTVHEFVRQCASAAGNNLKKAKRIAERFVAGGDAPDCVLQHLHFGSR